MINFNNRCPKCNSELATGGCPNCNQTTIVIGAVPRTPYKCPVCDGSGKVLRPPWVAGDQGQWSSNQSGPYPCQACGESGIVWSPE